MTQEDKEIIEAIEEMSLEDFKKLIKEVCKDENNSR